MKAPKDVCHAASVLWYKPLFFYMFQNVLYITVEDITQSVEGSGANGFAVLHTVDGIGGKPLFVNQMIFRDTLFQKRVKKRLITNHAITKKSVTYLTT